MRFHDVYEGTGMADPGESWSCVIMEYWLVKWPWDPVIRNRIADGGERVLDGL